MTKSLVKKQRQALRELDERRADHRIARWAFIGSSLLIPLFIGGWTALICEAVQTRGHLDLGPAIFIAGFVSIPVIFGIRLLLYIMGSAWLDSRVALRQARYQWEDMMAEEFE